MNEIMHEKIGQFWHPLAAELSNLSIQIGRRLESSFHWLSIDV